MMQTKEARRARTEWISFLFALLYFTSYMTRKSFGAIKLGLPVGYLTEEQVGLIGSALFFAYGIGQLVSGVLGDRIDPRRLILYGLGATAVCNAAFPFVSSVPVLVILWAINGFAQAMFWPPLVKLMSVYFKGEQYTRASVKVSMAAQVALLTVFGASALAIRLGAWWSIFAVAVALALITAVALGVGFGAMERRYPGAVRAAMEMRREAAADRTRPSGGLWAITLASGLLLAFAMTALFGFLRDGLEEWLSTYLRDTYSLAEDTSTLMNVAMPLFTMVCVKLTLWLYLHVFHDEIRQTLVVALITTVAIVCLVLFGGAGLWLSLVLLMLAVGCIHSANVCLTCYLPARYESTGRVSTVAGLVNAFTYVGSTVATTALPYMFGRFSWNVALLCCAAVGAACVLCAALMMRPWTRYIGGAGDKR